MPMDDMINHIVLSMDHNWDMIVFSGNKRDLIIPPLAIW